MRVFIITKYFPPLQSAQAFQSGKVAQALYDIGIDVVVATGIEPVSSPAATSFPFDVHRFSYDENGYSWLPQKFNRATKEIFQVTGNHWVDAVVDIGQRLHQEKPFDLLFSMSTPFDGHLAGLKLIKKLNLPWCVSFSDPYPISIAPPPYAGVNYIPGLYPLQIARLRQVLDSCDGFQVSSSGAAELMGKASKIHVEGKFLQIPHIGQPTQPLLSNGKLAHIGNLTRERSCAALVNGVVDAALKYKNFLGLQCIGKCAKDFRSMVEQCGHPEFFEFIPPTDFDGSLAYIQSAQALLVVEAEMKKSPFLPSKFCDYAESTKPILALTSEGSAIDGYLRHYGGGIAARHDASAVSEAIRKIFDEGEWAGGSEALAKLFTCQAVGKIYGDWFESVASRHRGR